MVIGLLSSNTLDATLATLRQRHPSLCGLELRRPDQASWITILPDPSGLPDTFKVQHFDRNGLGVHEGGYASPEQALAAALAQGYTREMPGILNRLSQSAAWQGRYQPPQLPVPQGTRPLNRRRYALNRKARSRFAG